MKTGRLRWLLPRLLVAGALYALFYTGMNFYLSGAIEEQVAQLAEDGHTLEIDELLPGEIARADDAGPLWRAAAELSVSLEDRLDPSDPSTTIRNYELEKGEIRGPDPEAEEYRELVPASAGEIERLQAIIEDSRPVLDLLLRAAGRPGYKSTLDYRQGINLEMKHLLQARNMAYTARLAAELALLEGNIAAAVEHWKALRGLARWQAKEATLVAQLIGLALERILCHSVRAALETRALQAAGEEEIRKIQAIFASPLEIERRLEFALNSEMILFSLSTLDALLSGERPSPIFPRGAPMRGLPRLWLKAEKLTCLEGFSYLLDNATGILARSGRPRDEPGRTWRRPWYSILAGLLIPVLESSNRTFLGTEAEWRLTFYALELRLHKLKTGSYPATLDELASGKRPAPPLDPFGGAALIYEKSGEGFTLRSIGENFRDDGGEDIPDGDDRDDIVASLAQ